MRMAVNLICRVFSIYRHVGHLQMHPKRRDCVTKHVVLFPPFQVTGACGVYARSEADCDGQRDDLAARKGKWDVVAKAVSHFPVDGRVGIRCC